jgi:hypothetical protein
VYGQQTGKEKKQKTKENKSVGNYIFVRYRAQKKLKRMTI